MHSSELLSAGRTILDPVLAAAGFEFEPAGAGQGSGGPFARGAYVRGHRRLTFSVRWALGDVVYHLGSAASPHEFLVLALQGRRGAYPGFSADPLDGFRHLRADLEAQMAVFLSGSDEALAAALVRANAAPRPTGLAALERHVPEAP